MKFKLQQDLDQLWKKLCNRRNDASCSVLHVPFSKHKVKHGTIQITIPSCDCTDYDLMCHTT